MSSNNFHPDEICPIMTGNEVIEPQHKCLIISTSSFTEWIEKSPKNITAVFCYVNISLNFLSESVEYLYLGTNYTCPVHEVLVSTSLKTLVIKNISILNNNCLPNTLTTLYSGRANVKLDITKFRLSNPVIVKLVKPLETSEPPENPQIVEPVKSTHPENPQIVEPVKSVQQSTPAQNPQIVEPVKSVQQSTPPEIHQMVDNSGKLYPIPAKTYKLLCHSIMPFPATIYKLVEGTVTYVLCEPNAMREYKMSYLHFIEELVDENDRPKVIGWMRDDGIFIKSLKY